MTALPNCSECGRFVTMRVVPYGWWAHGEFGEETSYVCPRCVSAWTPQDGRGRDIDAGYCGVVRVALPEHRPDIDPPPLLGSNT